MADAVQHFLTSVRAIWYPAWGYVQIWPTGQRSAGTMPLRDVSPTQNAKLGSSCVLRQSRLSLTITVSQKAQRELGAAGLKRARYDITADVSSREPLVSFAWQCCVNPSAPIYV